MSDLRRPLAPHPAKVAQPRPAPHAATRPAPQPPHPAKVAQARAAPAPGPATSAPHPAKAWGAGPSGGGPGALAVQLMQREHLPDKHISFVPVPTMEGYQAHVKQRVGHFFWVFVKAVLLYRRYNDPKKEIPRSLFTDTAAVQEGVGYRLKDMKETLRGEYRWDAAHLMNTSLNKSAYKDLILSTDDSKLLDDLHRVSGATTNQFQTSNVSSDKVIDAWQTHYKNSIIKQLNQGEVMDCEFLKKKIENFVNGLLEVMTGKSEDLKATTSTQIKFDSYRTAVNALKEIKPELLAFEIWKECLTA